MLAESIHQSSINNHQSTFASEVSCLVSRPLFPSSILHSAPGVPILTNEFTHIPSLLDTHQWLPSAGKVKNKSKLTSDTCSPARTSPCSSHTELTLLYTVLSACNTVPQLCSGKLLLMHQDPGQMPSPPGRLSPMPPDWIRGSFFTHSSLCTEISMGCCQRFPLRVRPSLAQPDSSNWLSGPPC